MISNGFLICQFCGEMRTEECCKDTLRQAEDAYRVDFRKVDMSYEWDTSTIPYTRVWAGVGEPPPDD